MELIKIAGLCLCCALLANTFKKAAPELALLLALSAVLCGAYLLLSPGGEVLAFARELAVLTGLPTEIFTPLLKTVAIALTARFCSAFCRDAGESALAVLAEIAGTVTALLAALPLFRAVLSLMEGYL